MATPRTPRVDGRRASEAQDFLLSCLRFRGPGDTLVPYIPEVDDRNPVAFVPPADKPHSSGWNQVWNVIATLPDADRACEGAVRDRDAAIEHLRAMINCTDHVELIQAIVAATRWLDNCTSE